MSGISYKTTEFHYFCSSILLCPFRLFYTVAYVIHGTVSFTIYSVRRIFYMLGHSMVKAYKKYGECKCHLQAYRSVYSVSSCLHSQLVWYLGRVQSFVSYWCCLYLLNSIAFHGLFNATVNPVFLSIVVNRLQSFASHVGHVHIFCSLLYFIVYLGCCLLDLFSFCLRLAAVCSIIAIFSFSLIRTCLFACASLGTLAHTDLLLWDTYSRQAGRILHSVWLCYTRQQVSSFLSVLIRTILCCFFNKMLSYSSFFV